MLVEHSLVHWYQQRGTVHHVPKCMSCHKAIIYIYMYIYKTLTLYIMVLLTWNV